MVKFKGNIAKIIGYLHNKIMTKYNNTNNLDNRIKVITLAVLAVSGYLITSNATAADTLVYQYHSKKGIPTFSDVEPKNIAYKLFTVGCFACNVSSLVDWYKTPLNIASFSESINKAAKLYQVDPALIRAIIHAESHFDANALSKVGAQGLMQLMPATAKELGVKNAFIAKQNINGGVKHLAKLLKKYRGNVKLVAAAYNAGEGAVKKYGGIPPFSETQVYVERVQILHGRYRRS